MIYHPDHSSGKSESKRKMNEAKFKLINEAYEVLKDQAIRAQYDNSLKIKVSR